MNYKICAILMIAICMVQFSMQDDKAKTATKPAAKPAATTVAPATYAAPVWGGYSIKYYLNKSQRTYTK